MMPKFTVLATRRMSLVICAAGRLKISTAVAVWISSPRAKAPMRTGSCERCARMRSEEHTSELQSLAYLVCRLLLEKKKKYVRSPVAEMPQNIDESAHQHRTTELIIT